MKNARFWINGVDGGAVKLTLRPGQTVTHRRAGRHEEGTFYNFDSYTHEGSAVRCEWYSDSNDCDGRHTSGGVVFCALNRLSAGWKDENGTIFPEWQSDDQWQRDHFAEAMGY